MAAVSVGESAPEVLTWEEYVQVVREANAREEWPPELLNGVLVAMARAKPAHNIVSTEFVRLLSNALFETNCTVYSGQQGVRAGERTGFIPDVVVACEEPHYQDDSLTNPTLVVEVLSESTAEYDRGPKLEAYKRVPSLQQVVFVHQKFRCVEVYERVSRTDWTHRQVIGSGQIAVGAGVTLSLDDVYRGLPDVPRNAVADPN